MRSILLTVLLLMPSLAFADHHEAPADEAPADEAPADEAPADEAPADEAPAEDAPADEAPAEDAPADEAPADEAPADEAPTDEAPAEDAPADEAPAEDAPVDEAPADEAPADEAPTDEAPAEDAPAEDAPAEEAPAADEAEPVAQQCTYTDLQGDFTITVECEYLQDYTGHSQPHKRIWLGGAKTQFNIIEVPEPYRTAALDVVMEQLGRDWGPIKTPVQAGGTSFAGIEAMMVGKNKQRSTSTTWIFNLNGRNVIANAVALGMGIFGRKANLAELSEEVQAGFKLGRPEGWTRPSNPAGGSRSPAGQSVSGEAPSAPASTASASTGSGDWPVTVGAHASLEGKSLSNYERFGVARQIKGALGPLLGGQSDEEPVEVQVLVRDFRLRSTGEVVMTGMMSGPDFLEVTVIILRGGEAAYEFDIEASVVSGGFRTSESARLRAVIKELADEFEDKL